MCIVVLGIELHGAFQQGARIIGASLTARPPGAGTAANVLAALGGSVGTADPDLTAEVVPVVDLDELATLPDEAVAGKIVFFTRRMERNRHIHTFVGQSFSVDRVRQTLELLRDAMEFVPAVVIIDRTEYTELNPDSIGEMKAVAEEIGAELVIINMDTPGGLMAHMRDIVHHDFACVTDHGYNINPYLWRYTAKLARVNDDPQKFLTFLFRLTLMFTK
mgnify:CR=1 FL=1